jgi:hypothetical protein
MPPGGSAGPADLWRLLLDAIDSFEKLELVLALSAAPAPRTGSDLVDELGLREPPDEALAELRAAGVLVRAGAGWRIDSGGPWSDAVTQLRDLHAHDRTRLLELMTTASLERLRGQAARRFADAFLLRRGKKEDDHDG